MRTTLLILVAISAAAQSVDRVFNLPNTEGQNIQELGTLLRTITDTSDVSVSAEQRSISVKGTTEQMALMEWLIKRLDQPFSAQRNADTNEYTMSNTAEGIVWLSYVPNAATVQDFQEIATAVRTTADIRRVFTYNAPRAIVFRGRPEEIALAKWVVGELDRPLDAPKRHDAKDEYRVPPASDDVTREFYAAHAETIQEFQELATVIRTMCDIRRVFTYNSLRAISLRGTPDQMAMAEWLFDRMDVPLAVRKPGDFTVPKTSDDIMRIDYLANTPTVQDFQNAARAIRDATQIRRVFTYNSRRVIALRGTTDQLARAKQMIAESGW